MRARSTRAVVAASTTLACALVVPSCAFALGTGAVPQVSLPGPVGSAANGATGAVGGLAGGAERTVGGAVGGVGGAAGGATGAATGALSHVVGSPTGSSGGGSSPSGSSTPSGSSSSGPSAGPSAGHGGDGQGGGGSTSSTGGGGVKGASAHAGSGGRGAGSAGGRGANARRAGRVAAAHAKATDPRKLKKHKHSASGSGFTHDIRTIVRVIPTPIWGVIGALILLALGFPTRSRLIARRARRLERQRQQLLGDVGLLQRALLPEVPDRIGGLTASVAYRPAEGLAAGGDFYDVVALDDDRTAIIVGDVMGHGRDALAVTALMRYSLRAYLTAGLEPRTALKVAGRALDGDPEGELTTVVAAVHDASNGVLTYACAGHEPPIIVGQGRHEPVTTWSSPPLGGSLETGNRQTSILLEQGARVCFFTDGLVEARLGNDVMGRELLTEAVDALGPDDGAPELLQRVAARAERTPDDMAACIVTACGERADSAPLRVEELEIGTGELDNDRLEAFLHACGVPTRKVNDAAKRAGGALVGVSSILVRVTRDGDAVSVTLAPSEGSTVELPALSDAAAFERLALAD